MQYIFLLAWLFSAVFTPYINSGVDYVTIMQIEIALLCIAFWLLEFNKNTTLKRSLLTVAVIYYPYIALTDWLLLSLPIWLHIVEVGVFAMVFLYQLCKKTEYKSDVYNSKYVHLIFFKPKSFYQWFISLFGSPVASMGSIVSIKGVPYVFRLKHNKPTMCKVKADISKLQNDYLIINTGTECDYISKYTINKLMRQSAYSKKRLYTRTNCVESQQPLIDKLGIKWHNKKEWYKFEWVPGKYLKNKLGR